MREVQSDQGVHLLSHLRHQSGTAVLHGRWEVGRLPNRVIASGRLAELDELLIPAALPRLRKLLRRLAIDSGFQP